MLPPALRTLKKYGKINYDMYHEMLECIDAIPGIVCQSLCNSEYGYGDDFKMIKLIRWLLHEAFLEMLDRACAMTFMVQFEDASRSFIWIEK